jgi:hypothetical protein
VIGILTKNTPNTILERNRHAILLGMLNVVLVVVEYGDDDDDDSNSNTTITTTKTHNNDSRSISIIFCFRNTLPVCRGQCLS